MIAGFKVDMAHPCMPAIRTWRDAGLIKPIDPARIEAWDNIFPELLTIRGMQHGGDHWLLPWDWGASSIVYRTDLVDIEEESYALLLDERYQGRMAMYDYVDEAFPVAALLSGAEDHLDMTDEELERAADVLRQIHKNMLFYWEERTTLWQAMASGEIVAAFAWNDAIVELKKQGVPVKFMIPEGRGPELGLRLHAYGRRLGLRGSGLRLSQCRHGAAGRQVPHRGLWLRAMPTRNPTIW